MATLKDIENVIEHIAKANPNVGEYFVGDIYELNHRMDIKYSAVVLTEQQHTYNANTEVMQYGINLFYVDRLTSDKSNENDIKSYAIEALRFIVRELEDTYGLILDTVQFTTFTNRFESECAGAFATFNISCPISACQI